ncbi:hypothetical protein H6P81_002139 [Aristolochia fimbriata]|uniref:ABC1 atypical kinase-like domain-containing protein n=1 Tax=Aristolochia fimbriata TaxID=158543 RepID=A0AAV7FC73_ARIFI|nr:hypothetical protein H6P81_002139 [Aristolochia fimbriata]
MTTMFVEQGTVMDTKLGSFSIPPASLSTFDTVSVIVWVPIYDRILVPIARKFTKKERGFSELQRMGIGLFVSMLAMAAAAIVEIRRLQIAEEYNLIHEKVAVPVSIFWQVPQYVLVGAAEIFTFIGQLEFFYDQSPDAMRSLCSALSLVTTALGNYLSSFILTVVTYITTKGGKPGWIPDNLNEGHLDYYFWLLAGLSFLNMLVYAYCAVRGKTPLLLLTAAGLTALTLQQSNADPFSLCPEVLRRGFHGVARSSRALYTIALNVSDYKYALRGLPLESDEYRQKLSEVHLRSAKRILELCEANKGFYVKAGQFIASIRQVPKEYTSTLSSLQDKAVPCHFKAIRDVLVNNLGEDLSEIFLSVDEEPIAAASIAQVHRALLKDYQEVAIKVQYPGLEQQMGIDLATMSLLSGFVAWIFPEYRFEWVVSDFKKTISLELDFVQEAKNCERTSRNFRKNDMVKVPHVYWGLTTNQVLTMQFCKGNRVDDIEFLKEKGINPIKVAKALVEVFAEMIFVHGFLHGDPHPGNILVCPEGGTAFSLVILDHGIYKELDDNFRLEFCELWKALILQDQQKIFQLGEKFGVGMYSRYFPVIFTGRTIESKSALGRGMSAEEKRNLKQELSFLKMEDISVFMESLPEDFLKILRTDGLLRSIISKLGAPQRIRILAYMRSAVYGLNSKQIAESDSVVKHAFSRIRASLSYWQLRAFLEILELLSEMGVLTHLLMKEFRKMVFRLTLFLKFLLSELVKFVDERRELSFP